MAQVRQGRPPRHEDVMARFVPVASKAWKMLEEQVAAAREPKLVVRKTFLEMQVPCWAHWKKWWT